MSAAHLPIVLEEHSNLTFDFVYLDEDDNPIDVTNYGGTIVFAKDKESTPFAQGNTSDGWVNPVGTDGIIAVNVPYTAYQNLGIKEGWWELYIYPTANDITDRPKKLIKGPFTYEKSLLR